MHHINIPPQPAHRIKWVDYAKTFAILGVMLLHLDPDPVIKGFLKTYSLPLFFFISGYLFSFERNPEYKSFVAKRFRQLVVPYFWMNVIAYICWYFVARHYGSDPRDAVEWYMPLIGIATGIPPLLSHDIPLWSLLCFFMAEIIYYPLQKYLKNPLLVSIVAMVTILLSYIIFPDQIQFIPLAISPTICALIFYSLGYFCRQNTLDIQQIVKIKYFIVALSISILSMMNNTPVNFFICQYGNFLWFILGALAGIYMIVAISYYCSQAGLPKFVTFISKSTLVICGFHLLAYAAIKGIFLFLFHIQPQILTQNIWTDLLMMLGALAITLPTAWIIRRYFRFLVDK